jgi:hypothetical protein
LQSVAIGARLVVRADGRRLRMKSLKEAGMEEISDFGVIANVHLRGQHAARMPPGACE